MGFWAAQGPQSMSSKNSFHDYNDRQEQAALDFSRGVITMPSMDSSFSGNGYEVNV